MIKLSVDEAYAFDYLSILEVKLTKRNDQKLKNTFDSCKENIYSQVGEDLFNEIFESIEYEKLFEVNNKLFEAVDLAKKNLVTAKYVDDLVFERYLAKTQLQKKFFKEDVIEVKMGYENV